MKSGYARDQEILQASRVQIINDAEKRKELGTQKCTKLVRQIPRERKFNHLAKWRTKKKKWECMMEKLRKEGE